MIKERKFFIALFLVTMIGMFFCLYGASRMRTNNVVPEPKIGEQWVYLDSGDPWCHDARYLVLDVKDGFVMIESPGDPRSRRTYEMRFFTGPYAQWHRSTIDCLGKR